MKRMLSILLVLALTVLALTGCAKVGDLLDRTGISKVGEKLGQWIPFLDKTCEHEYEAVVTEPTCTATGYTTYTCKLCNESYTADETAVKNHDYKNGKCSCGAVDPDYVAPCNHEWVEPTCTAEGYCSKCQAKGEAALGHNFTEGVCSVCGASDPDYVAPCEHEWVEPTCTADGYCSKCQAKGEAALSHKDENGDFKCDACEKEYIPDTHEKVSYTLNVSDLELGKRTADEINGVFTIKSGTEVRSRSKTFEGVAYSQSVKVDNSLAKIVIAVPGTGKLSFLVQNGSSGVDMQFITVTAPDGTVYDIEFAGVVSGSPVVKIEVDVTEGEWVISRGKNNGTQDIFLLSLESIVEKSDENGFALVSEGKVDYLVNGDLDFSGIRLNATFSNGKVEPLPLESVEIDASAVNIAESGTYPVVISYKEYETITVYVNIFTPDSIELGFDAIEKIANNSYGNGVYYNHSFKELYFVGEQFDATGLTVTVVGKCGERTLKFVVDEYTVDGFDSEYDGMITVTVHAEGLTAGIELGITNTEPTPNEEGVYMLLVDPEYEGCPGVLSGEYYVFSTIQEALDYMPRMDAKVDKELYVCPGYYNEKLEITVPNLKIIGWGESPDDVVIEWDSLYGQFDASGFSHVTDSTATVAIRESAHNVTIENITISNYWNSQDRMDAAGLEIERGLALLVQADQFTMKNSKLLGIQDTLELFTGRQYFENVYISGYTDFIFGTNNTTLFKNCTIHVIDTAKDDKGTAGYITAFKGSNKGVGDSIVYGAIFDGCKFTADEGVTPGCTAIGRTWAAYAAVAVINSDLGAHISKSGYSTNKNERYLSMNGKPTDATVQFVEFGNTGAGAIEEEVAGMRFLTAEEAVRYTNMSVIFGTINGNVSYLDPWMPGEAPVVDDRTYYYFDNSTGEGYNTFDTTTVIERGATLEWEGLLISAEHGNVAWNQNANALNMKTGAFIKFNVSAGSTVTVITYPNYAHFTLNGVGTSSADMLTLYYAEDTEVVLLSTGDLYLYAIIINPGEDAYEVSLNEIKVSGLPLNYEIGAELDLSGVVVKAYYSDNSVITLDPSEYSVNTDAVNSAAAGSYDVVFSYGSVTVSVAVTYEGPNVDPAITESIVLDFTTQAGYDAVESNPKVTLEGNFRNNGSEHQIEGTITFQVKAGTVVTIVPYANTQYASYTFGKLGESDLEAFNVGMSFMLDEDCTVVYTGLSNNYLYSIHIACPLLEGTYVFGGSSAEGTVTGILTSGNNIEISGTCKTHSGGAQLGSDSMISFSIPASSTLTVKGYDTNYGKLAVYVDGALVEMDDNACYVIVTENAPAFILICAQNVGTEEAPDWGKSYITYIQLEISEPEAPVEPSITEWALDATLDLEAMDAGAKADGDTATAGTEGFFTVYFSAKTKIDSSGKTFVDGYTGTQRINMGGSTSVGSATKNAIEFTTDGAVTVTVWWVCGGDGRELNIYDANGLVVYTTAEGCIKNSLYISTIEIAEAGKYYLGSSGSNYYFKVEVKVAEAAPAPVVPEGFTISFGSAGNYHDTFEYAEVSVNTNDNGTDNSQVKEGTITLTLFAGAKLTINGYPGYTSYTLTDASGTTDTITDTTYEYVAAEDCVVVITPIGGGNYLYSIVVEY